MLNYEKLEALLNTPHNCEDNRLLRLMSYDNIIKYIYAYCPLDVKVKNSFNVRAKAAILKFDEIVNYILTNEGNVDKSIIPGVDDTPIILPTMEIIQNATLEIAKWYFLLESLQETKDLSNANSYNLPMMHYIVLANFCGIFDVAKNINNSKFLRRYINFTTQTLRAYEGSMSLSIYLNEIDNHKTYIKNLYKIYIDFDLKDEDFLTFMMLFDIRKNKNIEKLLHSN